jgi:excisionase family DNA binding protein
MTMPASARAVGGQRLGTRLPSATDRASANQLRRIIAAQGGEETKIKVTGENGKPADVILTEGLSSLLLELLRYLEQGDAVTLVPITQMLTTQQAADILNVSRPFLIQLLERGVIGFTTTGRHRRIKAEDLFQYKAQRDRTRADALSELAELDADLI